MTSALQRATQGFAAVAVTATLVAVGGGLHKAQQPLNPAESGTSSIQAVPRPMVIHSASTMGDTTLVPAPAIPNLPSGIALPSIVYQAYLNAEASLAEVQPVCRLRWAILAGIGQVESGHARGGALSADGTTTSPIFGPTLNGEGFAAIRDTDGGSLDGDPRWDRAVGPMQFIPASWAVWGTDGNGDGMTNPHNIYDATLTAGRYLCADDRDLSNPRQLREAILSYNSSSAYADIVLDWIARYSAPQAPRGISKPRPSLSAAPIRSPAELAPSLPTPSPSPPSPAPESSAAPVPSPSYMSPETPAPAPSEKSHARGLARK